MEAEFGGLSSASLELIQEQYEKLFLDLCLSHPPSKIDSSRYYFLGNYRFGFAYLLSSIVEEDNGPDLCTSCWQEMKLVYNQHKEELQDRVKELLDAYFKEVPSTFLASAKAKLYPETVNLLKLLGSTCSDEEVESSFSKCERFAEWLKNYYTFHEDGAVISGFRGISLSNDEFAVFVNKVSFQTDVSHCGLEKAKRSHVHLVVHELMHLQSDRAKGAVNWDYHSITTHDPRGKLDEGLTEIFARTIVYRLLNNGSEFEGVLPGIRVQGSSNFQLPVYECLKEIAVDIVREIGLEVAAKAYFEGHWNAFTAAISAIPKFQNPNFWKSYSVLSHTTAVFRVQGEVVMKLNECGIALPMPEELVASFGAGEWKDSLLKFYPHTVGNNVINL